MSGDRVAPVMTGRTSVPRQSVGTDMTRHGTYPRDVIPPRSDFFDSGRFGRMFGGLPPFASDTPQIRQALLEIGKLGGSIGNL